MLPMKYAKLRSERLELVRHAVSKVVDIKCLRGSWVAQDFHVSRIDGSSFSDVDLASSDKYPISDSARNRIYDTLTKHGFPLRVSAHREDSLALVSVIDARILKICEYLSKIYNRDPNADCLNYWRAKTVLLLLQNSTTEGCEAISNRIGTPDSRAAFAVKLGEQSVFDKERAARLINSFGSEVAREFLKRGIETEPETAYVLETASRLQQCSSINSWLQSYVIAKMGIDAS